MTFRIERSREGTDTILRLSGRLRSVDLAEVTNEIAHSGPRLILDLAGVSLVDIEVVRFLNAYEGRGIQIVNAPAYIGEWMRREREGED